MGDKLAQLQELKSFYEQGFMTKEEFDKRRIALIDSMTSTVTASKSARFRSADRHHFFVSLPRKPILPAPRCRNPSILSMPTVIS
jgi:hypothetical protein